MIWTHDLRDTDAALYQLSQQAYRENYLSSSENKQPVRFCKGKLRDSNKTRNAKFQVNQLCICVDNLLAEKLDSATHKIAWLKS